jgi:PEGA domain
VALLAYLFQRKPTEIAVSPEPSSVASSKPRKASTPAPAPEPAPAAIEPEAVPAEPLEPLETLSAPSPLKRGKNARSSRRVAAAPVATTPAEAQITVSSTPADATVQIEGLNQSWRTPQTIGSLTPGTYKVTVGKPGYAPEVRHVSVSAGNRFVVDVRLAATKGFLNIAGSPAGAGVLIDGKDTGKVTPATFMLDPAVHHIVLSKSGYLDSGTDIQLAAGQTVGYSPSLMVAGRTDNIKIVGGGMGKVFGGGGSSQGKSRIEIKSDPRGAQVIINGTALQKTTPVEVQVEAGNYDITLQKDGYKAVHENAIVGIEDRVKIDKTLSR